MRERVGKFILRTTLAAGFALLSGNAAFAENQATYYGIGNTMAVIGDGQFERRVRMALGWIESAGSPWPDHVSRNLADIRQKPSLPFAGTIGINGDGKCVAVFKEAPVNLHGLAGQIIHEADHCRYYQNYLNGGHYSGSEAEQIAYDMQESFLRTLNSPEKVIRPQVVNSGPPGFSTLIGNASLP